MDILHELRISANQASVYQAFATETGIQGWWCKDSQIGSAVGDGITLHFMHDGNKIEMNFEITTRTDTRVEWACISNSNPAWVGTRLCFEAKGVGDETNFTLAHIGFHTQWADSPPYLQTVKGWIPFVESFKSWCEQKVGQPA